MDRDNRISQSLVIGGTVIDKNQRCRPLNRVFQGLNFDVHYSYRRDTGDGLSHPLLQKDGRLRSWRNDDCCQWVWNRSSRMNHDAYACNTRETNPCIEDVEDVRSLSIDDKHEAERSRGR